jgi:hypothetical protein
LGTAALLINSRLMKLVALIVLGLGTLALLALLARHTLRRQS